MSQMPKAYLLAWWDLDRFEWPPWVSKNRKVRLRRRALLQRSLDLRRHEKEIRSDYHEAQIRRAKQGLRRSRSE